MGLYYIAHRLFSAHDRALGAYVAQRLACRVGADAVFLPFCDTDEENLTDACKGRRLFELDCERLRRIDGMLALLHGPSLDDGVCMEIGYAAALGIPVVVLTTDFQTYGLTCERPSLTFADPLLDMLVTEVVRVHRLGLPGESTADRFGVFLERNLRTVHTAADQAITALLSVKPVVSVSHATAAVEACRAFVEPSPYLAGGLWRGAVDMLTADGWEVHVAGRFHDSADPREAAQRDWAAYWNCKLTLIDVSGPETPPGAAIITGASAATGRRVLAAEPGTWWTFADGREPNWRNLMIQYAISGSFATVSELAALVGL
jgi:nucleoside 2-deoxyribosyltransferase